MKNFWIACSTAALSMGMVIAVSTGIFHAVDAQDASNPAAHYLPVMQAAADRAAPLTNMPADAAQGTMSTSMQTGDLTGQTIYGVDGNTIGTVSSMTTDARGQQAAIVAVENVSDASRKNAEIPVSSLQPRNAGGYATTLSPAEIANLPEYQTNNDH